MEDLNLPAHRIPFDLFDCLRAAIHLKVGQQLPLDALAPRRRVGFHRGFCRKIFTSVELCDHWSA